MHDIDIDSLSVTQTDSSNQNHWSISVWRLHLFSIRLSSLTADYHPDVQTTNNNTLRSRRRAEWTYPRCTAPAQVTWPSMRSDDELLVRCVLVRIVQSQRSRCSDDHQSDRTKLWLTNPSWPLVCVCAPIGCCLIVSQLVCIKQPPQSANTDDTNTWHYKRNTRTSNTATDSW